MTDDLVEINIASSEDRLPFRVWEANRCPEGAEEILLGERDISAEVTEDPLSEDAAGVSSVCSL